MWQTIGSVIADKFGTGAFKLTGSPAERQRKFAGTPQTRNSAIRRPHAADCPEAGRPTYRVGPGCTCGKQQREKLPREERMARRAWRYLHRRHWIIRAIINLMMALPECAEFSPPEIAERIGASERAVQDNLAELASRRCFKRMNHGGRGHRLAIKINRTALLAFASRLGIRPTLESWQAAMREGRGRSARLLAGQGGGIHDPDRKGADSLIPLRGRSASGAAIGPDGHHEPLREQEPKPPTPTKAEIFARFKRAKHARDPDKRMRGLIGAIRYAAWYRSTEYPGSRIHAQVFAELVAYMGKRSNREAVASAVFTRLLQDSEPIPTSWPAVRRWQFDAQDWTAQWQERRRWESSPPAPPRARPRARPEPEQLPLKPYLQKFLELGKQTRHTDAPGRVFSADSVVQYPLDRRQGKQISPTAPVVSGEAVSAARASQLFAEILDSLPPASG